jgi:hypothetical protein
MNEQPPWKSSLWFDAPTFAAYRHGRFIVAELKTAHQVISTSSGVGGLNHAVTHLVNHQSCEGADHKERYLEITAMGPDAYHKTVCNEIFVDPESAAVMGTAANMI